MAVIGKDILKAAQLLTEGKLVAIPTETVYGLASNALDVTAVAGVFKAKNRPTFDPLIIHTYSIEKVKEYCREFPSELEKLAKAYWPGPLTLLLPKKNIIPDLVTSGLDRVAVRIPNHPLTLELLQQLNFPLAAPSANPFGYVSPTKPEHVNKQLGNVIDYILDGGNCEVGIESTIVGMENGKICIYRLGGSSIEQIEKVVGKNVPIAIGMKINNYNDPSAPGQLKSHYSPTKKLIIGNIEELLKKFKNAAVLSFGNKKHNALTFNLSEKADITEAAANLFTGLRTLDESDAEIILCDYLPETGLGIAINDRLTRASAEK
ncbi:MAG TPA: L-threonylcarbamoyladenylate synthase [Bacteroidia bacterium]|jgi:L-threonylcarbamoyladenylate synthase|nr:L-threonylcarbamoyladenylate synthase [Bacteroidia bacterium]